MNCNRLGKPGKRYISALLSPKQILWKALTFLSTMSRGKRENPHYNGSGDSTIWDYHSKGYHEPDNTFKMFECCCWASYGIFRTHCYSLILWGIKTREGQNSCLPQESNAKQITLPKWTAVGEITTANIILALLAPKPTGYGTGKNEATVEKWKTESLKVLSDKSYLTGLRKWSQNELVTEYWFICYEPYGFG